MKEALPLEGIKVLDLSRVLAGPFATQRLADLGAQVIKVERPGLGDETRKWGPPWQKESGLSAYFSAVNRGKRSVCVDLSTPKGLDVVMALARGADVVIHNLKHESAERLGLTKDAFAAASPGVVLCQISGFGSGRSPSSRPGYDLIVQAESGLMSITGEADGKPHKVGVAIVDVLTGLEAATSVLAALVGRKLGDPAVEIEVPLLDAAMAGLVNVAQGAMATGSEPQRFGNAHASIVPYEAFSTADGQIVVAASNDAQWVQLCVAIGDPALATDPRFLTNPDRVVAREVLIPKLESIFEQRGSAEWIDLISHAGVPCGNVLGVRAAFDAAAQAGEPATLPLEDGTLSVPAPARFDGKRVMSSGVPPRLGQHTDQVLTEAGFSSGEIKSLRATGTVA